MIRFIYTSTLIVVSTLASFGQGWKKDIEVGNALLEQRRYAEALDLFQAALFKNEDAPVNAQMVKCYEIMEDWYQLAFWSHQLYKENPSSQNLLEAARAFKKIGEYRKARLLYKKFLSKAGEDTGVLIEKAGCDSALVWRDEYLGPKIRNFKSVNTEWSESAPVVYEGDLVFVSNREGTLIKKKNSLNRMPFFDLYRAEIEKGNREKSPKLFDRFLANRSHFGPACFTPDGKTMYFTKSKSPKDGAGPSSRPKLYMTSKDNGSWSDPLTFVMNDSSYVFGHPSVSPDGNIFLFSSNMDGGYGGLDLYFCIKIEGSWSEPINLGPEVNSPGNEISPFLQDKTTLYFSSDYHLGMGGYDVFSASLMSGGKFGDVENAGAMVNSSFDDVSYFEKNGLILFASNRQGGKGKEDIYYVKRPSN